MFGLATTDGVSTLEDEHVRAAIEVMRERQAAVETLTADEARLLRILNPLANTPSATDEEIDEAQQRLDIKKGTQSGWYLPELGPARTALKDAITNLEACRAAAVTRLDAIRREARKPLIAEWVSALETLLKKREVVVRFDNQWDADRDTVQPGVERTTLEPLVTADSVDRMKTILKAQGWL
jgi:hypothetical protein